MNPASSATTSDPTLRANPFPKVTDPFCRLPLPTLFYQLEAVHLGDLLRLWVRTVAKADCCSPGFSRAARSAPDASEIVALCRPPSLIASQTDSEACGRQEEKRTLPGAPVDVSGFMHVAVVWGPATGSGILTGFPFDGRHAIAPFKRS